MKFHTRAAGCRLSSSLGLNTLRMPSQGGRPHFDFAIIWFFSGFLSPLCPRAVQGGLPGWSDFRRGLVYYWWISLSGMWTMCGSVSWKCYWSGEGNLTKVILSDIVNPKYHGSIFWWIWKSNLHTAKRIDQFGVLQNFWAEKIVRFETILDFLNSLIRDHIR